MKTSSRIFSKQTLWSIAINQSGLSQSQIGSICHSVNTGDSESQGVCSQPIAGRWAAESLMSLLHSQPLSETSLVRLNTKPSWLRQDSPAGA